MSDRIWIGLIDVQPGRQVTGGAYVYCAGRGESAADALAAVSAEAFERGVRIVAIEEFRLYADLPLAEQNDEKVRDVVAALGQADAGLDWFHGYPEEDEPDLTNALKERVLGFVEGWIDGAVELGRPFELGDLAFVAEMQFSDDDAPVIGWAYDGELQDAAALLRGAADTVSAEHTERPEH
jgi:hypothetical protein